MLGITTCLTQRADPAGPGRRGCGPRASELRHALEPTVPARAERAGAAAARAALWGLWADAGDGEAGRAAWDPAKCGNAADLHARHRRRLPGCGYTATLSLTVGTPRMPPRTTRRVRHTRSPLPTTTSHRDSFLPRPKKNHGRHIVPSASSSSASSRHHLLCNRIGHGHAVV